jgi:glutaredoxin
MNALIWSKPNCPYCDRAKALLKLKNIEYEERVVGIGWTKEQLLEAAPTARTVPQIFIDGLLVGGYDDLKAKFDKEEQ